MIHDGPDNKIEVFASIGCVELVGFDAFRLLNKRIIQLSGPKATTYTDQLAEIGKAKNIFILYDRAPRPALRKW